MSATEQIFLRTGLTPAETASRIADALTMGLRVKSADEAYLGRPLQDGQAGEAGGEVSRNIFPAIDPEPDEISIIDGYDIVFDIWATTGDEDQQRAEAEQLFTEITQHLGWPAVLSHNLDVLIAAWNPDLGRRDFAPPHTSLDAINQQQWQPYALPHIGPPNKNRQ